MTDNKHIEVTVRVPADLEVRDSLGGRDKVLYNAESNYIFSPEEGEGTWTCELARQIAAAVEARKPKPPKFQVGDVVEWDARDGNPRAGVITGIGKTKEGLPEYWVNGGWQIVNEGEFKLVRRAEK